MLYMLFFMKFLSGPIERAFDMLPQLKIEKRFDYDTVTYGLKLMLIGLMKKVLIADRLAPHLDSIFASVQDASGAQLLLAGLLYPIELYADFSGYTDMAIGGAMMFGYRLSPNFNRPFVAKTITDFWRRWHMSLSFWVRDYLYGKQTILGTVGYRLRSCGHLRVTRRVARGWLELCDIRVNPRTYHQLRDGDRGLPE